MTLRFFLILISVSFCNGLLAQGLDAPIVVQENISFESISDSNCTLFHLLIAPVEGHQDIYHREYSEEPDSIVFRDNRYFAAWNLQPRKETKELSIITVIEKLGSHSTISYERKKKYTYIETEGKTYNQKVRRHSKSLWDLAMEKYNNQESEDAIYLFDMLIEIHPNKLHPYLFKGVSYARLGEYEEAMFHLEAAEQFAKMDFDKSHLIYARANVYALKGDKAKCIATLDEAISPGFRNQFNAFLNDSDFDEILTQKERYEIIVKARKSDPSEEGIGWDIRESRF